jgi:hypothetical protein
MTPSITFSNFENQLKFSPCSINQFKHFLLANSTHASKQASSCLLNIPQRSNNFNNPNGEYPGQFWTANDQCKQIWGNESTFCLEYKGNMCETLFCRKNSTEISCTGLFSATDGTTCDSGKMCLNKKCTQHEQAQVGDCVIGESIVTPSTFSLKTGQVQMSCENFFKWSVNNNSTTTPKYFCDNYQHICCSSCKSKKIYFLLVI